MSDVQTAKPPAPKSPTKPPTAIDDGIPDQLRRTDLPKPKTYEAHPIATIFPRLGGAEINTLADDIKANGLRDPIWLYEGKILDGVNRAEACKRAEVEIRTWDYTGNDPIGFVLSANLHRRHLDAGQRAMVAASLSNLGVGDNQNTKGSGTSIEVAANLLNVGRASVERALIVLKSGDTKLIEATKTVAVSKAAEQAKSGATKTSSKKKAVTPPSTQVSDDADELVDILIDVLKEMKAEAQEAILVNMFKRFRDLGYIQQVPVMTIETEEEGHEAA
jgi:hypothetical protein